MSPQHPDRVFDTLPAMIPKRASTLCSQSVPQKYGDATRPSRQMSPSFPKCELLRSASYIIYIASGNLFFQAQVLPHLQVWGITNLLIHCLVLNSHPHFILLCLFFYHPPPLDGISSALPFDSPIWSAFGNLKQCLSEGLHVSYCCSCQLSAPTCRSLCRDGGWLHT